MTSPDQLRRQASEKLLFEKEFFFGIQFLRMGDCTRNISPVLASINHILKNRTKRYFGVTETSCHNAPPQLFPVRHCSGNAPIALTVVSIGRSLSTDTIPCWCVA